jgi:hypothetical protein
MEDAMKIALIPVLVLAHAATSAGAAPAPSLKSETPMQTAVVCFKKGERTSGMNKICYYDCMGSDTAITIGAVELCPLTIDQ